MTPWKKAPARFYSTAAGAKTVEESLASLPPEDRRQVGHDIGAIEYGWPLGMPLCRSLGEGLWEVHCSLPSRRIARVMFCLADGELILLHGFIKKARKTMPGEMALARNGARMKKTRNPHVGSRFDDWLKAEGIHEEVTTAAMKRVLAWQLEQAMQEDGLSKSEMARRMATSRPQLDRLLDPQNGNVTLDTIAKAAAAVGRKVRLEIV